MTISVKDDEIGCLVHLYEMHPTLVKNLMSKECLNSYSLKN